MALWQLEEFTEACIAALFFTDTGEDDQPDAEAEMSDALKARIEADCHSFWARCWFYVKATDMTAAQAGHDFWLTRNGHGAGFWDGDWQHTPYADMLTQLAKAYGEVETYLADDGAIYG